MREALNLAYDTDASQIIGKATKVFLPQTVFELKQIVKQAKRICIRGGGSGLAGGCVPQNEPIIDLSKMNKIEKIDPDKNTIEVEAGVILDDLQNYLGKYNLEFPVQPSSHAICTIGGILATNAVGSRAIKYGRTFNWVKWIEVMNSDGEIEKKGITELSDYIGMEGITGIIVNACLKLSVKKKRTASLMSVINMEEIVKAITELKRKRNVSMIEFLDKFVSKGIGFKEKNHLIIEYEDDSGEIKDDDYKVLMSKRDDIYPFLAGLGYSRIEDPKILINKLPQMLNWFETNKIPVFGHISVGILHPCFNKETEHLIPELMKMIKKLGGQITGEHGIGLMKKEFIEINDKKLLINMKKRLDKNNKFNLSKVI